jgi:proteasome lid subunit RPN8/RPN11
MHARHAEVLFALPGAEWSLKFSNQVVVKLDGRTQRRWYQRESVGQLFSSDLISPVICVDLATSLKPKRSSSSSVTFDTDEAIRQREEQLVEGRYCIGMWHTHPEPSPEPSGTDTQLASDHAKAARPVLNGLVFVIVGNVAFPQSWYVSVHDGKTFRRTLRHPSLTQSPPPDLPTSR